MCDDRAGLCYYHEECTKKKDPLTGKKCNDVEGFMDLEDPTVRARFNTAEFSCTSIMRFK